MLGRDRRTATGGLVETTLHAGSLLGHDLVQFAAHIGEDIAELVPLEEFLAPPVQPIHQVAQTGHVGPSRIAGTPAPLAQPPQRGLDVALGHHVVGQRVEDLVRVQVGQRLAAVPGRVAGRPVEQPVLRAETHPGAAEIGPVRRVAVAAHRR